jgi:hypothetical protein
MYGTSILQATDARPTFGTVTPLYQKSVLRGKLDALLVALTGRSSRLADIAEVTGGRSIRSQRALGAKVVRIADIQASEERADDFDRSFHPLETHTKSRWLSIALARLNGQAMPAIELIKIGEVYAVRDGHHRISVARALGEDYIDAHVTVWDLA